MVARYLLMAASQVMGLWRNVAGERETFVTPANTGTRTPPTSPMSWYMGSQNTPLSSDCIPKAWWMARMLAMRFPWLTMTPLGRLVEPEVYWSMASASGEMAGSCQRSAKASGISSVASHESREEAA